MKRRMVSLGIVVSSVLLAGAAPLELTWIQSWPAPVPGRSQIGNMHGDVAVSSTDEVYVSVMALDSQNKPVSDPLAGLQVYGDDGRYIRNVPGAPDDLHGFIIRKEAAGEFLYGVRLPAPGDSPADAAKNATQEARMRGGSYANAVIKMTLDGTVVQAIPESAVPDRFKVVNPVDGKPYLRLTGIDVAPNGDIYVTDGYLSDYIHHFDRTGHYLSSFGGREAPYSFRTLHQIAIDSRFTPARIIACDRANNRVVHLSLNGEMIGEVATNLLAPADVAIVGDYAVVGELRGRMSVLDKAGNIVSFGSRRPEDEPVTRTTEPAKWRSGIVNAPHGIGANARGDIFVSEFTVFGRVDRFHRQ